MQKYPENADDLVNWIPPRWPDAQAFAGRYARLERLAPAHAAALHRANAEDEAIWDYLPYGPFSDPGSYAAWVAEAAAGHGPLGASAALAGFQIEQTVIEAEGLCPLCQTPGTSP